MAKAKAEITSVPALVVTPEKAPVVSGNFTQIETYLQKWQKQVSKMEITEDNMEQVRLIKKEAVAYRNSLTRIQNDIKKTYFNDPKAVFEARMGQLLGVIVEVERAADQVLETEEKARVAGINEVIDHYIEQFQTRYSLDDEHLARIERKKSYYNKTAEEKARKDAIEQQFKDLKKDQDAYAANIRLITATCKEEPRLNVQHWIDQLRHNDVATVTEAIITEKQRLLDFDKQEQETGSTHTASSAAEDADYEAVGEGNTQTGKVVIGVPCHIDFKSDFKGRTRSLKIELVYPCDLGDALTQLFDELRQYGIKVRPVKETVKPKETVF
jgi:uncharacterized coiled-coil DUF342 family protein